MTPTRVPRYRLLLRPFRDGLAASFGLPPEAREQCVRHMLARHRRDAVSYWFQLFVAMGLATLGLVLNSVAVVIGAMLISPLMGPLVELGMGLAIGSAVLTLRALLRTLASIGGVVGAAALLTRALPFDQVTTEISSRSAPTVLDLFIAALCALMAGYTTVRATSDTTATAAGTAIGIALVPPLCVVGWGIGTWQVALAKGAALLFTANFCAILAFNALMFFALGFDDIDVASLEHETAQLGRLSDRVAQRLRHWFGSAYGASFRFGLPLIFAASVFIPLRRALTQVEWEVRVRSAVERIVGELSPARESVQSSVAVGSGQISVRLVIVASTGAARQMESELRKRIQDVSGVDPSVQVTAVPDAHSLQRLASAAREAPVNEHHDLDSALARLDQAVRSNWPSAGTGKLIGWTLEPSPLPSISVEHFGAPIGPAAAELLSRALGTATGLTPTIRDLSASSSPITQPADDGRTWLQTTLPLIRIFRRHPERLFLCIEMPQTDAPPTNAIELVVHGELEGAPDSQLEVRSSDRWSALLSESPCPPASDGSAGANGGQAADPPDGSAAAVAPRPLETGP